MADPVEIHVVSDPKPTQTKGDWTVLVGPPGRGSREVSSHREKDAAIQRARRAGRARKDRSGGAVLKVHDATGRGRPSVEARYGDAQGGGSGLFGGLF